MWHLLRSKFAEESYNALITLYNKGNCQVITRDIVVFLNESSPGNSERLWNGQWIPLAWEINAYFQTCQNYRYSHNIILKCNPEEFSRSAMLMPSSSTKSPLKRPKKAR